MKENVCVFLITLTIFGHTLAIPAEQSFVVSSTETPKDDKEGTDAASNSSSYPIIYEMNVGTNISNRFARTLITSKVKNSNANAQETTFTVVLPEQAFISEFIMEIDGKSYKAYVKEKEEAKNIYDQAVASGQSAAHVAVSARDSNRFTVSVNVEPESKAVFLLTYEELLERKNNQYELVLNMHPGQIVKRLNVDVHINESRPLKFVRTPSLRSGNEISKNEDKLDPLSDIEIINSTSAIVQFSPDAEKQKQLAKDLGTKESDGLAGQFIVQYDVERDPYGGEILLQDGYFVHFFAPSDLEPLPKHVVFVLDTSGSMSGRKIDQLKDAMNSILGELRKGDLVNIIDFNSFVTVWDITSKNNTALFENDVNYSSPFAELSENKLPSPTLIDDETKSKAKSVIKDINAYGATHMIGGLEAALYLIKVEQDSEKNKSDKKYQPMIIFLTDGAPNIGVSSKDEIVNIVTRLNSENNNVPIFSLSFGYGANKEFLKKLSQKNQGFSRHIYEASDASLQLQEFYKQISSPLLSQVNFTYESEVKDVTKLKFPIYFGGSELVASGKYEDASFPAAIDCWGPKGRLTLTPTFERPVTSLERLWAYLTVKQTLDERDSAENKTLLTKKALDLALKYSFVTEVTSLVVVKPNDTTAVDTEEAKEDFSGVSPDRYFSKVSGGGLTTFGKVPPSRFAAPLPLFSVSYSGLPAPFPLSSVDNFSGGRPDPYFSRVVGGPVEKVFSSSSLPAPIPLSRVDQKQVAEPPALSPAFGYLPEQETLKTSITVLPYTEKPALGTIFPWLLSVLNANATLTVNQNVYELGDDSTLTVNASDIQCPTTPLNSTEPGVCTLLKDCPEVHSYLTDFQVYQQYFCALNKKYAGVCCPKKQTQNN